MITSVRYLGNAFDQQKKRIFNISKKFRVLDL
jgi:hypothetical protein